MWKYTTFDIPNPSLHEITTTIAVYCELIDSNDRKILYMFPYHFYNH